MKRLTALFLMLLVLTGCTKPVHKPVHNPPQTDPPVPITESPDKIPSQAPEKRYYPRLKEENHERGFKTAL